MSKHKASEGGRRVRKEDTHAAEPQYKHAEGLHVDKRFRRPAREITVLKKFVLDPTYADNIGEKVGRWWHHADNETSIFHGEAKGNWRTAGIGPSHTAFTWVRSCGAHLVVGQDKVWVCIAAGSPAIFLASQGRIWVHPSERLPTHEVEEEDLLTGEAVKVTKQSKAPDLVFLKQVTKRMERQFKERTSFHDIPRGPDASEDNRKIADWCEQLIKYVGTVMLKDVTTFEWSPVKIGRAHV